MGYEDKWENPEEDAMEELQNIIEQKLSQWEYELRYPLSDANSILKEYVD